MSEDLVNLRARLEHLGKKHNSYIVRNNKRNDTCPFVVGQCVMYKDRCYTIIENNGARGHSHMIRDDETQDIYSIINCIELTPIEH